jgi:methylisocitrate lyase
METEAMKRMSTIFRESLAADEIMVEPVVFDALSGRIAEGMGYRQIGIGGFAVGASLGTTEPLMCIEDLVRICRYVTASTGVPLRVDVGAGFGGPLQVMRTVWQLEAAGVAAISIRDQAAPQRAASIGGIEQTIPAEEMVEKLKAAVAAQHDPDLALIAQTNAMKTEGFEAGIRRANLYLEAGADMVLVAPNNREEAARAPKEIAGHVAIDIGPVDRQGRLGLSIQECQEMGYKMASDSTSAIFSAAKAAREILGTIKTTGTAGPDQPFYTVTRKYVEDTIGLDEWYRIEAETVGV